MKAYWSTQYLMKIMSVLLHSEEEKRAFLSDVMEEL